MAGISGLITPGGNTLVTQSGAVLVINQLGLSLQAAASFSAVGTFGANAVVTIPANRLTAALSATGAFSADATVKKAAELPGPEWKQGTYRPLTWPSYGRPWRQ